MVLPDSYSVVSRAELTICWLTSPLPTVSIVKVYLDLIKLAVMVWFEITWIVIEFPVREVPVQPENSYPCSGVATIETEEFSINSPPEVFTFPPSEAIIDIVYFWRGGGELSSALLQV